MSRVAAIDCGTNSIRILVADVTTGSDGTLSLRDVHREQRVVRLGKGVDATGLLDPAALERTRVALADYTAVLRRKGAERVRIVATSATRDAHNREDFYGMVRATLGVDAEVISGDEEARCRSRARWASLTGDGPFVVADTAAATELVIGELTDEGARRAGGVLGRSAASICERCLDGDPPSATEIARPASSPRALLDEAFAAVPVEGAHLGRRGGHDHHAVRLRPAAAATTRPPCTCPASPSTTSVASRTSSWRCPRRARDHPAIDPGRIDVIGRGADRRVMGA
jgi:exopolyphosphatase/guanosine-5'-triphosphate,3'-diphosphate pyrophosphatase